jgi:hypothetical protein
MSDTQDTGHGQWDEDLVVEHLSNSGDSADTASSEAGGAWENALPRVRPLTASQRASRVGLALGGVVISLALILGSAPHIRAFTAGLSSAPATPEATFVATTPVATPTPAYRPNSTDQFVFSPNVPWGKILLDGQPLPSPPTLGDSHPLRLPPGQHQLVWHAEPFSDVTCTLSVPNLMTDTCPVARAADLAPRMSAQQRSRLGKVGVITIHESLAALPLQQSNVLFNAIQAALDAARSSTDLQVGEHYLVSPSVRATRVATAEETLHVTLGYEVIRSNLGWPEPCIFLKSRTCRFPAQDCRLICTIASVPVGTVKSWVAAVWATPMWQYVTDDGTIVSDSQPENGTFVITQISWDGAHWQVTPLLGHQANMAGADATTCDAGLDWLAGGPLSGIFTGNLPLSVRDAAAPVAADGCALLVNPVPDAKVPPEIPAAPQLFLERFGALLAANDAAHAAWPDIPVTDAGERQLAAQLAAQIAS